MQYLTNRARCWWRWPLVAACLAVIHSSNQLPGQEDLPALPGEDQLPWKWQVPHRAHDIAGDAQAGDKTAAPTDRRQPADSSGAMDFFSEAVLATQAAAQPAPPSEAPGAGDAQPPAQPERPGEHVLASQFAAQDDPVAAPADHPDAEPEAVDMSPGQQRPWLRLQYPGHTETVRTLDLSADGRWAVSGGEDKLLHVWHRDPDHGWMHRRSIRWQVERATRGRIYQVALRGQLAAVAGYGAMGGLGEIWIVDIETGQLQRALVDNDQGHRQVIAQLAWAPGQQTALASADLEGRVMLWKPDPETGLWSGRTIVPTDGQRYGVDNARRLQPLRNFVSLAFAGPDQLIVPQFAGTTSTQPRVPLWTLQRRSIDGDALATIPDSEHRRTVVAMAASRDGRRLATIDEGRQVRVWTLGQGEQQQVVAIGRDEDQAQPLCVRLDATGNRLVIGDLDGVLELWTLEGDAAARLAQRQTGQRVFDCALGGAEGAEMWAATGAALHVYPISEDGRVAANPSPRLATSVRPIRQVAFSKEAGYELAFGFSPALEQTFDLSRVQIGRHSEIEEDRYRRAQPGPQQWTARAEPTDLGVRFRLFYGDQPRARLPLLPEVDGPPTAMAVIHARPDEGDPAAGQPLALAVGTSISGNIYIYQTPNAESDDPPRLLRQFRGHGGAIESLSVSFDGQYLASSSRDATIAIWPLAGLRGATQLENLWGLDLQIQADALEVGPLRQDGPLFFRGLRAGDQLVRLRWFDPEATGGVAQETDPEAMAAVLRDVAFDTQVVFDWQRRGEAGAGFQSFPAWQPLAQLFVDADREWAMWTPAGIYDASANGSRRFGWQVNRGVDRLPDYFRADQFRQRLERPDVMRRLLDAGSLAGALASRNGALAPIADAPIQQQIRARPHIRWTSPQAGDLVDADHVVVEAQITIPGSASLATAKVYADAVAARQHQLLDVEQQDGQRVEHHRWEVPLVHRPTIQLEILAATQAGVGERTTRSITRKLPQRDPSVKPRLHLLAMGISRYRDPQIQSLDFAARGAAALDRRLAAGAGALYRYSGVTLTDDKAVRSRWNVYVWDTIQRLSRQVRADDLVVMYLCGHGLRDRQSGRWYFVTADARHTDLMNGRYSDCLSLDDLTALAALPCRKLAILDSCHSGAVQPLMRPGDLKSVLRWLQDDRVLTLTASEGHQEAVEQQELGLGRFTARLIEALEGHADQMGNGDGVVTLREAIRYVRDQMQQDARRDGFVQRPTASPVELLESIHLPLTRAADLATGQ